MTCDKCGYNPDKLTEYMETIVPKQKLRDRIIEIRKAHQVFTPDGYWHGTIPIIYEAIIDELQLFIGDEK